MELGLFSTTGWSSEKQKDSLDLSNFEDVYPATQRMESPCAQLEHGNRTFLFIGIVSNAPNYHLRLSVSSRLNVEIRENKIILNIVFSVS